MLSKIIVPISILFVFASCENAGEEKVTTTDVAISVDVVEEPEAQGAITDYQENPDEVQVSDSYVVEVDDVDGDQPVSITNGIDDAGNEVYNVCARYSGLADEICRTYPRDSATTLCPPHCFIYKQLPTELLATARSVSSDQVAKMANPAGNKNAKLNSSFSIPPQVIKGLKEQNATYVRIFQGKRNNKNVLIIGGYDKTGSPIKDGKIYSVPLDKKKA